MTDPAPNHLRLHRQDHRCPSDIDDYLPQWDRLAQSFQRATGWQLLCREDVIAVASQRPVATLRTHDGRQFRLALSSPDPTPDINVRPTGDLKAAEELAEKVARVYGHLLETQQCLRKREAELATAIPVVANSKRDGSLLEHKLTAVLHGTVESLDLHAAALYLLDDATSQLKLRTHWGLPEDRFRDPPRQLATALADLEALTGHAVVLEDRTLHERWNVPEDFGSALCVPVSSDNMLLGTFWCFGPEGRDYSPQETELAEIIAGRLACELERSVLLRELTAGDANRKRNAAIEQWERNCRMPARPKLPDWQIASAWANQQQVTGFPAWHLDQRGELHIALVTGDKQDPAGLHMTLARGALASLQSESTRPAKALTTLNHVLWSTSAEGSHLNCAAGRLMVETGKLQMAVAGRTQIFILRPFGWEPLEKRGQPVGQDDAANYKTFGTSIAADDIVLLLDIPSNADSKNGRRLAEKLLRYTHLPAESLAAMAVKDESHPAAAAVVLKRTK